MCPQVNDPRVEYSVCLLDAEYVDGHDSIAQTWFFVYKADARLRLMEAKV
jgi:cellulose synthase/poly-beta-1,6-N-acetylglucosamine synthase-like glycosyltransferase